MGVGGWVGVGGRDGGWAWVGGWVGGGARGGNYCTLKFREGMLCFQQTISHRQIVLWKQTINFH